RRTVHCLDRHTIFLLKNWQDLLKGNLQTVACRDCQCFSLNRASEPDHTCETCHQSRCDTKSPNFSHGPPLCSDATNFDRSNRKISTNWCADSGRNSRLPNRPIFNEFPVTSFRTTWVLIVGL